MVITMTYQVTTALTDSTPVLVRILSAKCYEGNIGNDEACDPRLQLKCCIKGIGEDGEISDIPGIPGDAWFISVLRMHQGDEAEERLMRNVGSLLRACGVATPNVQTLNEGLEEACENINSCAPLTCAAIVTTSIGKPKMVVNNGIRTLNSGPRFLHILYVNEESSAYYR